MDYSNEVIAWDYTEKDIARKFPFFNVLKDGRVHVLASQGSENLKVPPSDDHVTGVRIKDVKISSNLAARVFLPPSPSRKLPLLLYAHGGGFCMYSAFSARYTRLLTSYVAQSNIIAVSVEYRLFPDHPISVCYDDSWTTLLWIASHYDPLSDVFNQGPCEPWIRDYADLKRIFVGGNSAGANISHTLMTNVRKFGLPGDAKVEGMILVHPYFAENDKLWMYMCPTNEGPRDPRMKPVLEDMAELRCDRVLVVVAEKDALKNVGVKYVEELKKSGWKGKVEFLENRGRVHGFHTSNFKDSEALVIDQRIRSFILDEKLE
ncbi:hypothetical protein RND81_14G125600 [Saponaria officinalis]|uniref:Alpha/beta hydrolase fold-3 domain-containing protein n=1 Tax=Saponaria officinalis TaxID=3572 RepID=A0AAW1GT97_SAPOF